jgi:hypothetical protein
MLYCCVGLSSFELNNKSHLPKLSFKKCYILFFRSKNVFHLSIQYNDKLETTFDNRL